MNTLYCIQIDPDTKIVSVQCIGMFCVDNKLNTTYNSCNELPEWVQDKIAVLMVAKENEGVVGVGCRTKNSFYITEVMGVRH